MREYENMEDNILFGDTNENLKETFEWAGYDDADSAGGYNLWAPDVIYNEDFEWGNGETGAYLSIIPPLLLGDVQRLLC